MHPLLRVVADRQFGAFASEDAIRAGYTPEEVRSEVSRGRWVRLRRGVYAERAVLAAVDADPERRHRLECAAVLVRLGGRPRGLPRVGRTAERHRRPLVRHGGRPPHG